MVKRKIPTPVSAPVITNDTAEASVVPKKKRAKRKAAGSAVEPAAPPPSPSVAEPTPTPPAGLEPVANADAPSPGFVIPKEMRFYCLPCKEHQTCPIADVEVTKSKNNRWQIKGKCPKCDRRLYKFITKLLAETMNGSAIVAVN